MRCLLYLVLRKICQEIKWNKWMVMMERCNIDGKQESWGAPEPHE